MVKNPLALNMRLRISLKEPNMESNSQDKEKSRQTEEMIQKLFGGEGKLVELKAFRRSIENSPDKKLKSDIDNLILLLESRTEIQQIRKLMRKEAESIYLAGGKVPTVEEIMKQKGWTMEQAERYLNQLKNDISVIQEKHLNP